MSNENKESLEQKLARLDNYAKQCKALDHRLQMHVQQLKGLMLCIVELASELNLLQDDIAQEKFDQIVSSNITVEDDEDDNDLVHIIKDLYKYMLAGFTANSEQDTIVKLSLTVHSPGNQSCKVHTVSINENFDNICIACTKCGAKIELTFVKVIK